MRSMGGGKPLVLVDIRAVRLVLLDDLIKLDLRQQYIIGLMIAVKHTFISQCADMRLTRL